MRKRRIAVNQVSWNF